MKTVFSFFLLATMAAHAQELEGDLLNALGDSSWGSDFTSSNEVPNISREPVDPQDQGTHTSEELNCNDSSERNTVPYKFLLGLMANKEMEISHDPHSGILSLKGGIMIGNCNSMLDTIVSKPNDSIPFYTYQVAVKQPSSCSGEKCLYDVTKIENGENKGVKGNFRPTFEGFVNCLKATGVFKDGQIVKGKVAPREYVHQERDVTKTSELVYANRGLKGARYNGRYSGNKLPEYPGCYYFEDIKKGGFKTYSVDDMESYELERLYQKVCNSGNYKLINNHISDFDQLAPFQSSLEQIRNELIMEEVKGLHEIVTESEDLSEVDTAKFKEVTSDFLEYVIKPIKNDLAQLQRLYANPGHSQKENILKSVFGPEKAKALLGKGPAELKKLIKKDLDIKASELVSYAREPYLTSSDFKKMTEVKSKAPLASDTWMSAVLDLYEAQSTAFHYGRYSNDFWESHYEDSPGHESDKRFASGADLDNLIASKLQGKKDKLGRVAKVAKNPDVDYAAQYSRTKQTVIAGIDKEILETKQKLAQLSFKVRTQCMQEKQQKYWINQQACVRDAQEQLEACQELLQGLVAQRSQVIRKYDGMIADWNEAKKGAGATASDSATTTPAPANDGRFTFKPVSPSANAQGQPGGHPNMQNQYSQQMRQMQMQMQMRQQQSMRPNWQSGGGGMGLSLGLNGGMGMGMMGMGQSMYGRNPAYSPMRQGGMMGGPMGYYGQNMTQYGGMYNMGMGGGGQLPTMGPQPYMPAYSPMAPSGGGASTGFSFGF